jgi:hypothetical protein
MPLEGNEAVTLVDGLHGLAEPLSLDIVSVTGRIRFGIRCAENHLAEVERVVRGTAPHLDAAREPWPWLQQPGLRLVSTLSRPDRPDWAPIKEIGSFAVDPLGVILEACGEDVTSSFRLTCVMRPAPPSRKEQAFWDITVPIVTGKIRDLATLVGGDAPRGPRFEARWQRVFEERLARPGFEVQANVSLFDSDRRRLLSRARSLTAAFASLFDASFGGLVLSKWRWEGGIDRHLPQWGDLRPSIYFSDRELASLWHLPSSGLAHPGLNRLKRQQLVLSHDMTSSQGVPLGPHRQRGGEIAVRLPRADLDSGGAAIIGRRGSGKSTLALQINKHLLSEPDQPSVAVFDPDNDFAHDLVAHAIPPQREGQVAWLELGDVEHPASMSLFHRPHGVTEDVMDEITFALLKSIFAEQWSSTRMADLVFALTGTLSRMPKANLLDTARLLRDRAYRRAALRHVKNPTIHEFWADYESTSEPNQHEWARPVLHRFRSLYHAPALRNMLCQSRGLDLGDLLDHHGVLVVSAAGQAIQAESDLLVEVILARLHLALVARLDRTRDSRNQCYITVDESQRFMGASLPTLMRQGRKLGSSLILITTDIHAWNETLGDSVIGNAGALVMFRAGPGDARRLRDAMRPFTPEDVESLDRYEAIARLQVGSVTMPAVDIHTQPIAGEPDYAAVERIRAASRHRYTRPRSEVEAELAERFAVPSQQSSGAWLAEDIDEE